MRRKAEMVAAGWKTYHADVLPQDASELMVRECRRSFYAGAHSVLSGILNSVDALDAGTEPTEEDLMMMEDLQEELERFALDVIGGRA